MLHAMPKLVGTAPQLWATPVAYQPTNLLNDGIVDHVPERAAMLDTPVTKTTLPTNAPALLYWAELMNVKAGDVVIFSMTDPHGSVFAERSITLPKKMAAYFNYVGKKNSSGYFTPGLYRIRMLVMRGMDTLVDVTREVTIQ